MNEPSHWDDPNDRGRDFHLPETDTMDDVLEALHHEINQARHIAWTTSFETLAVGQRDGQPVKLRWIKVHLVEEYARHCGHADLLRDTIDGTTGD